MQQTTVSSRIPQALDEALEATCRSEHVFRSEIIRRALRYYFEQNPDGFESTARTQGGKNSRDTSKTDKTSAVAEKAYDPVMEF